MAPVSIINANCSSIRHYNLMIYLSHCRNIWFIENQHTLNNKITLFIEECSF